MKDLFDISGKEIPVAFTKLEDEIRINMDKLINGFYLLEIRSQDITVKKKILKN